MACYYETAKWMTYRLGYEADKAIGRLGDVAKESAMTKLIVGWCSIQAAHTAMQIHGSYGLMDDYKISRIYKEVAFTPTVEGVEDMQKIIVSKYLVK
jgi:alkylation response protein AidB-like acyl-CoA dehydrogenase